MGDYFYPLSALSQCLLLAGLVVRPSPYRWILWPLIACINCYCFFLTPTDDPVTNEGLRFFMIVSIIYASDYILLTDVQRELRLPGQQPISSTGFWSRTKWGLQLWCNVRGVGWAHEPRSVIPPHPNLTRPQFLTSRFLRLATHMLMNDIAHAMLRADPFVARGAPPSAQQPWLWRFWSVSLIVFTQWCTLSTMHTSFSIFFVASRLSTPDSWPDAFGKWSDAYTLRKFWGRTWHQFLRRPLSSHGKYVAQRVLHLPPGSNASSYTQLYIAFLISGIIHTPPSHTGPFWFCFSQAFAITFEDAIIALAARIGLVKSNIATRILGYVWVYCSFVQSFGWLLDYATPAGISEDGGMKFSLIMGLHRGDWYPQRA